jgi:gliding motility-associated-like protein
LCILGCLNIKKMFKKLLPFFLFVINLFAFFEANATHIVGGELNYKLIGVNKYEIRLTVYRDCWVGVPPFDDPASVGIFNSNNQLLYVLKMPFMGLDTLPPDINDPCVTPPTNFCYEITTYIDTIVLPPLAGGYQISYQRCCRNQNILNIINPKCTGATYYATIPGPEVVAINSNPVIKFWPPPFICLNKPWVFNDSAIDYDGDSLVYELFMPYEGLTASCPVIGNFAPQSTSCPNIVPSCPNVPVNPPFSTITWKPPYTTNNMLGGIPMQINSVTGQVTATPNLQGYFVIGIKVKEYRNGVFLSETKRDFQLIVLPCPSDVVASAAAPSLVCGTNTPVVFTNNSTGSGAINYNWNFGDNTTLSDSSHVLSPNYLYPGIGTFTATLISYLQNKPFCRDSIQIPVLIDNEALASYINTNDSCSNKITFASASTPSNTISFWYINAIPTSTLQTFSQSFVLSGTYTVQLIAQTTLGCKDTTQKTIVVPVDSMFINAPKTKCINKTTQFLVSGGDTFSWQPASSLSNSTIQNPVSNATTTTVYTVTVKQNSLFGNICIRTLTTLVTVNPIDSVNFNVTNYPCTDSVHFTNTSLSTSGLQNTYWSFDGGASTSTNTAITQTYSVNGMHAVSLLTVNAFGCRDSVVKSVNVFNFIRSIVSNDTICKGFTSQLTAQGGTSYTWTPATFLSNPFIQNPVSTPNATTTYSVIIENNSSGYVCKDTISATIVVNPKITTAFNYSIGFCSNNVQFIDASFSNPINWAWNFGDANNSVGQNPLYYYSVSGTYTTSLISINSFGCKDTSIQVISLPAFSPISVNSSIIKCESDTVQLKATGGVLYSWQPSQTLTNSNVFNPLAFPATSTIYSVTISTLKGLDTCKSILTAMVNILPFSYNSSSITVSPSTITLGQSSNVTLNGLPVNNTITVVPDAHVSYTGVNSFAITPAKSGEYTIYSTDANNCRHTLKTIYVEVHTNLCNEGVVYLPTGFTPNNDGVNDVLYIRSNFITDVYLTIYDRWGEKLFETNDVKRGWDGTFKGKQLDQGVYGYYMTFTCNNGEQSFKKGNITLTK